MEIINSFLSLMVFLALANEVFKVSFVPVKILFLTELVKEIVPFLL